MPLLEPSEELNGFRNLAISEIRYHCRYPGTKGATLATLIFDASRDNPLRQQQALMRTLGTERGLGRMPQAEGVFAIYSAGVGQTALERLSDQDDSPNSVFARILAPALARVTRPASCGNCSESPAKAWANWPQQSDMNNATSLESRLKLSTPNEPEPV